MSGFKQLGGKWYPTVSKPISTITLTGRDDPKYILFLLERFEELWPKYDHDQHFATLAETHQNDVEYLVLHEKTARGLPLPGGVYIIDGKYAFEYHLRPYTMLSDTFVITAAATELAADMQLFFDKESVFRDMGMRHKRSALLYGSPGNGKTTTIISVTDRVCRELGIAAILLTGKVDLLELEDFRTAFDGQPVIFILEELLSRQGTDALEEFLDGYSSWNSGYVIATTNHRADLEEAIARPGRFDLQIEMRNPTDDERQGYLQTFFPGDITKHVLVTKGLSWAQIKEAVLRHRLYDTPFADAAKEAGGKTGFSAFGI